MSTRYDRKILKRLRAMFGRPHTDDVLSTPQDDGDRPILSLCITTYNRADWLAANLKNWSRLYPCAVSGVEVIVCDNASTDRTNRVVRPYLSRPDFRYKRNAKNVGMLGNLRETALLARGDYIWIIGDDDIILPSAFERILAAIEKNQNPALIYLHYSFTLESKARKVRDFETFYRKATPREPPESDRIGTIREICARNENFFTAIYTLVFRRDHAIRAYSQDTSGRPFSTMLTCIPTTYYVIHHMMDEPGVWIGEPQIVVNLNVSWMQYAPLWILERIPEVYAAFESKGVPKEAMDRWRRHTLPGFIHYFKEILRQDPIGNAVFFSPSRAVRRYEVLPEFWQHRDALRAAYAEAQAVGSAAAKEPIDVVFPPSK